MDTTEQFNQAWRARYPTEVPPDLGLEKQDPHSINKALLDCKKRITDYKRKINQQEFVHQFLSDLMLNKKPVATGDTAQQESVFVSPKPGSLERRDAQHKKAGAGGGLVYTIKPAIPQNGAAPPPVQVATEELSRKDSDKKPQNSDSFRARQRALENSINKQQQGRDKLGSTASKSSDDLSQPDRSRNYVNLDYTEVTDKKPLERVGSDNSISHSFKRQNRPVPAPRPSVMGPSSSVKDQAGAIAGEFQERLSMRKTHSPVNIDQKTEDSKPYSKFNAPRRNHQYESIRLDSDDAPTQQQPPMSSFKPRTMSTDSNDSTASGMSSFKPLPTAKEVENPNRNTSAPPLYKRSDSTTSSSLHDMSARPKDSQHHAPQSRAPKLNARTESVDSNKAPESPHFRKKNIGASGSGGTPPTKEHIYDAPVPVGQAQEDSDSSSDEEPIYFNILLLKQKTMQKNQSLYSSVDLQKRHVENQARRLSKKYAQSVDYSVKGRPIPTVTKVAPPVMKPLREKTIVKGVTITGKTKYITIITII